MVFYETVAAHGCFQTGGVDHHDGDIFFCSDRLKEAVECKLRGTVGGPGRQPELARERRDDYDGSLAVFEGLPCVLGEIDVGVQVGFD